MDRIIRFVFETVLLDNNTKRNESEMINGTTFNYIGSTIFFSVFWKYPNDIFKNCAFFMSQNLKWYNSGDAHKCNLKYRTIDHYHYCFFFFRFGKSLQLWFQSSWQMVFFVYSNGDDLQNVINNMYFSKQLWFIF